jgi:PAS domain S-box-containing protein
LPSLSFHKSVMVFFNPSLAFNLNGVDRVPAPLRERRKTPPLTTAINAQTQLHQLITCIATQFLKLRLGEIDRGIESALHLLGEALDLDITYVAQFSRDRQNLTLTHGWVAPSARLSLDANLPAQELSWSCDRWQRGEIVRLERLSDLPPEAERDRHLWEAQGLRSLLALPLHNGDTLVGILSLGCGDRGSSAVGDRENQWSDDRIDELRMASEVIASALQRQIQEREEIEREKRSTLAVWGNQDGIWDWNVQTQEVFFSPRWKEMLGYGDDELDNHLDTWSDRVHPDDREAVLNALQAHFDQKTEFYCTEHRLRCKDGSYKWILDRGRATWDDNGKVTRMIGSHTDISDRKAAEAALHASEERWQLALQGANDGIWDWDLVADTLFYSSRLLEMLGYGDGEWGDRLASWRDRVHPDDREAVLNAIQAHFDRKTEFYCTEHRLRCKDGSYKWILDRGRATWDENGQVTRMIGSHTDISDRKAAEAKLHRANRALRTLSDCNQALVRASDETDLLRRVCDILVRVGGYRFAWVGYLERDAEKSITPIAKAGFEDGYLDTLKLTWADRERGRGPTGMAARSGKPCVFQNILTNPNYALWRDQAQQRGYASSIALPLLENEGVFGVLSLYSDRADAFDEDEVKLLRELSEDLSYGITALRDRRSLAHSEEKFRQLAENIEDVFWMSNIEENEVIYVSPAYETVWGRSCQSLYRHPLSYQEAVHPLDRDRIHAALRSNPDGYFDVEYRITHTDGSIRWIWDRGFPIRDESGNLYRKAGIAKDITERKQIEEMLRFAKDEMEQCVQQRTLELAQTNQQLQQELGDRKKAQTKLRKSEKLYRTLVQNFPDGAVFLFNHQGYHTIADGVGLSAQGLSREQLEGYTCDESLPEPLLTAVRPLYEAALQGESRSQSIEYRDRIYAYQALPVRNEQGEVFAGMIVMQDVTQRSRTEAERSRLIAILEATPDFIASAIPDETVIYLNQAARNLLGIPLQAEQFNCKIGQGHPPWAYDLIQQEAIPTALREGTWLGETAIISHDGREIPISQLIVTHKEVDGSVKTISTIARDITELKRERSLLREAEQRWRAFLENVPLAVVGSDGDGKVDYVNPFFLKLTGYSKAEVLGQNWFEQFVPPIDPLKALKTEPHNRQARVQKPILTKSGEERMMSWSNAVVKNSQGEAMGTLSIGEDITERAAIERMKDEFISVVSHELRTPLTSIHGALNLLASGLVLPTSAQGDRVIKIAAESAERLTRLVNDILELERLESGKIQLHPQSIQATDLLQQALDQMQVMANRADVCLMVTATDSCFIADRDRLLQVLMNLLSNAIKFSDRGQTVSLSLQSTPDAILFSVQDQGRGIPRDKIDSIFERFHQIDASDSRQKGGTGLGLAICRSIVEQHGGKIWVESTVDQGSCFYVSLPQPQGNPEL